MLKDFLSSFLRLYIKSQTSLRDYNWSQHYNSLMLYSPSSISIVYFPRVQVQDWKWRNQIKQEFSHLVSYLLRRIKEKILAIHFLWLQTLFCTLLCILVSWCWQVYNCTVVQNYLAYGNAFYPVTNKHWLIRENDDIRSTDIAVRVHRVHTTNNMMDTMHGTC